MLLIFRKNHEATFLLLSLLSDQKRGKSHLRGFSILLKITFRVHELVAGSSAWQVRAAKDKMKVGGFALSAISYYHACEHSARKSRADSCTHCLHARIYRWAGINTYAKHVCWRRRDGSQSIPLFVLFVLFGQAKRTSKEKFLLCIYERPLVDFGFLAFPDSRRPEIRTACNLFW